MLNTAFPPWPSFSEEEVDAVSAVLRSNKVNYWTGQECRSFEQEFANWCGVSRAVALANGTLALDLCWKTLGIGPGDEVICTPRTFIASASSIVNSGAIPVFADVDENSQNITPESAAKVLTVKTKAVLCVHLAGWPCDMEGFRALASAHDLFLVEDCAQAHGAAWKGKSVGSWGNISAWSYCQDKIMTTGGEGGMVTTDDESLWASAWSYKDHGKSWDAVYKRQHPPGFKWLHDSIGTNWRMLEMQAAIGRLQLQSLASWRNSRALNAQKIMATSNSISALRVPEIPNEAQHAFYKAYVFVRQEALRAGWNRDRIIHEVGQLGVPCYQGSCSEVYLEKAFDNVPGRPTRRLPNAKKLGESSLMFLVHPTLREEHIEKTCWALSQVVTSAQR